MPRVVLLVVVALAATLAPASAEAAGPRRLDGVPVRVGVGTTQVLTVRHTHGWHARATLWVLSEGHWRAALRTRDARTGYGGLVAGNRRRQGSGTTPLGTFALPSAFGTHDGSAGWRLPYRRIGAGDYWVGDNRSAYYNQLRTRRDGGFRWWLGKADPNASEHLLDYRRQYEYVVTTSFNQRQVRHRGTAIFLHVNGRGATAGCVSVSRATMRRLLDALDPAAQPVIAIGR